MQNYILFIEENEFYNKKRSEYDNVTSTNIFKNNNLFNKVLRKIFIKMKLPFLHLLFGDWKENIEKFNIVIISASIYSRDIVKQIQKKTNSRIIHWYWNPVIKSVHPDRIKSDSTELWSFDEDDCKKYKMNYISTYYFSKINLPEIKINNDVYFVGADKGRLDALLKLKRVLTDYGLKVNMHITRSKETKNKFFSFQSQITYEKVLEGISESRAILDIVQSGQRGMSQRPMEAIFFQKKLITNDINISKHDFYDKNNIFILGVDDIQIIHNFINSSYKNIDQDLINKYEFGEWINRILNSSLK